MKKVLSSLAKLVGIIIIVALAYPTLVVHGFTNLTTNTSSGGGSSATPSLQQVTAVGNSTTNSVSLSPTTTIPTLSSLCIGNSCDGRLIYDTSGGVTSTALIFGFRDTMNVNSPTFLFGSQGFIGTGATSMIPKSASSTIMVWVSPSDTTGNNGAQVMSVTPTTTNFINVSSNPQNFIGILQNNAVDLGVYATTTIPIGGAALLAGACTSSVSIVTGAASGMVATVTPSTYPGDGVTWEAYINTTNQVTTKVCAIVAGTPTASTYNVRVKK